MLADGLLGRVALDALRAQIPARDDAVTVQREDGVVLDRLHQQPQVALALHQALLALALLRHVARDLGKAQHLAIGAQQRGDQHVGPETAAVLAQPPAFVLPLALLRGRAQRLRGQVGLKRFPGVEGGKMPADDLVGAVALDALGAHVPGSDQPLGRQQEDGVVVDAVHEAPEQLVVPVAEQRAHGWSHQGGLRHAAAVDRDRLFGLGHCIDGRAGKRQAAAGAAKSAPDVHSGRCRLRMDLRAGHGTGPGT